jgi:hypothetical protein
VSGLSVSPSRLVVRRLLARIDSHDLKASATAVSVGFDAVDVGMTPVPPTNKLLN